MQTTAYVHDAAIHAVTRPCFERRALGGRHDLPFRVVGVAARFFGVSKMTVWRWRHDRAVLPKPVIEAVSDLIQKREAEAHLAKQSSVIFFVNRADAPGSSQAAAPGALARWKEWDAAFGVWVHGWQHGPVAIGWTTSKAS